MLMKINSSITVTYVVEVCCDGCFFFFFFQAEDGIRDADVTGVQTCALPICRAGSALVRLLLFAGPGFGLLGLRRDVRGPAGALLRTLAEEHAALRRQLGLRSEERRVGKECRSGWGRDRDKKRVA